MALSMETVNLERAVTSNDLVWLPAQMLVCSRAQGHRLCVRHGDHGQPAVVFCTEVICVSLRTPRALAFETPP